jgi:hypothetical protein
MEFEVAFQNQYSSSEVRVGNVYPIRGGKGARLKHMYVVLAITEDRTFQGRMVCIMVIDSEGKPQGTQTYALHYIAEQTAIGFVPGLDEMKLVVQSI